MSGDAEPIRVGERMEPETVDVILENRKLQQDIAALRAELAEAKAEVERLRSACIKQQHDIQQSLGKALGYPAFPADFNAGDQVCVGEHTAESLAEEASAMLLLRNGELEEIRGVLSDCEEHLQKAHYREERDDCQLREQVLARVRELIRHA